MQTPSVSPAIVEYLTTEVELLAFGPKNFFEELTREPSRYLNPYAFLVINIAVAGGLSVVISSIAPYSSELESNAYADATFGFLVAALSNVIVLVAGKIVGRLTREHLPWRELFRSYCYASAIYPVAGVISGLADFFPRKGEEDGPLVVTLLVTVSALVLVYIVMMLARGSDLHGRRYAKFVVLGISITSLFSIALVIMYVASIAIYNGKSFEEFCNCSK
jgi:hypothetical protein